MAAIVSMGDVDIDLLVSLDRYPLPGEESFAEETTIGLGGSAANTAIVLARLGLDVGVLAQIGNDEFGSRALRLLGEAGVDTDGIMTTGDEPTGMNIVVVDSDGERTMIGLRGANRTYGGSPGWESGCQWFHLSAYALLEEPQRSTALAALDAARKRSIPVSVDIPSGVANALGEELLSWLNGASVVAVGEGSLAKLRPEWESAGYADLAIGTLAVTNGEKPFSLHRGDETVMVTPPDVAVVDTTGAGDSFVAGLIAADLWGVDLGAAAVIAACLGVAATQRTGAGTALADQADVERLLSRQQWPDAEPGWIREARRLMVH